MGKRLNALICGKFGKIAAYIVCASAHTVRKERRVFNIAKQNIYNANIFDIYKFRKISIRPCGISLSVPFCAFCAFLRFLCLSVPFYAFCAFLCLSVPFYAFCAFLRFFILLLSIYTVPHIIAALRSALVSHWVFLRFLSAISIISRYCRSRCFLFLSCRQMYLLYLHSHISTV